MLCEEMPLIQRGPINIKGIVQEGAFFSRGPIYCAIGEILVEGRECSFLFPHFGNKMIFNPVRGHTEVHILMFCFV